MRTGAVERDSDVADNARCKSKHTQAPLAVCCGGNAGMEGAADAG